MSGFSPTQLKKLIGRLDEARIHTREVDGRRLDYIEGWFAISEANAIFGFAGWDREMVHFERAYEQRRGTSFACGYWARVRLRVRAGETAITREGTGFGAAAALDPAEAYERALKAAETDATKRALATFGTRFGLSLYDKGRLKTARVGRTDATEPPNTASRVEPMFSLYAPDGSLFADQVTGEAFCSGLRQLAELCPDAASVKTLSAHNAPMLGALKKLRPDLRTAKGRHYADILEGLLEGHCSGPPGSPSELAPQRNGPETKSTDGPLQAAPPGLGSVLMEEGAEGAPGSADTDNAKRVSRIAPGPAIDKSRLAFGSEKRIRDKAYLEFVASKPCLVCEAQPCHAHHVTYAQRRGFSIKVSDEFTIPLCALHHNELHRASSERAFWRQAGIDPLLTARALWEEWLGHDSGRKSG